MQVHGSPQGNKTSSKISIPELHNGRAGARAGGLRALGVCFPAAGRLAMPSVLLPAPLALNHTGAGRTGPVGARQSARVVRGTRRTRACAPHASVREKEEAAGGRVVLSMQKEQETVRSVPSLPALLAPRNRGRMPCHNQGQGRQGRGGAGGAGGAAAAASTCELSGPLRRLPTP